MIQLHHGDCLDVLRTMPDASVDAIVTDPPYGLRFMGKRWDYDVPSAEIWAECLRVLKPGGHLLAFAGTRTQHRMAVRIEDAGFEIRDMIAWVYGSGFPKSLNVSISLDKKSGAMEHRGKRASFAGNIAQGQNVEQAKSMPKHEAITDAARQWSGWGTALKPALEPITVARKPLEGTVAANVLQWGTGGINVDGCRVRTSDVIPKMTGKAILGGSSDGWDRPWKNDPDGLARRQAAADAAIEKANTLGRWPANLIHDGSDEVVGLFPGAGKESAARFFYTAKTSKADRDEGCEELEYRTAGEMVDRKDGSAGMQSPRAGAGRTGGGRNAHPTVKPVDLMCYLCRLVTPSGGIVLDPFMGSGSTGKACVTEGFSFIGIERDADSFATAQARVVSPMPLFKDVL